MNKIRYRTRLSTPRSCLRGIRRPWGAQRLGQLPSRQEDHLCLSARISLAERAVCALGKFSAVVAGDQARRPVGRFLSADPGRDWDPAKPQSWNMFAYVRGNPMAYIDPDGRVVDLAYILNDADRNSLIAQLRDRTGLDLVYENGRLVSNGTLTDANGNTLGSVTARTELLDAIDSETVLTGRSMNGSSVIDIAASSANTVFMDFADLGLINLGQNPAGTVNAASIFLHEPRHSDGGQNLADPTAVQLRFNRNLTGPNVDVDNQINRELGLPTRSRYLDTRDSRGRRHWQFSRGPVYLP